MGKKVTSRLILFLLLLPCFLHARTNTKKKKKPHGPVRKEWIKGENNLIEQPNALYPFFAVLDSLRSHKIHQAEMLHIGDSHLQADFFPQQVRSCFQQEYGNAGRGIVFPYRAAKTNESYLWKSSAEGAFARRRIIHATDSASIGLSGMAFTTFDSLASVSLVLNTRDSLNYAYRNLQVVCVNPQLLYLPEVKDSSGNTLQAVCHPLNGFCTYSVTAPEKQGVVQLQLSKNAGSPAAFNLHAFILGDTASGIVYHSVGINGAEYRHYLAAPLFFEETSLLHPSLLILSLGTNEAYARNFSADSLIYYADKVIAKIKTMHPYACVLITSPGDACKGRLFKNPNNLKAVIALQDYCKQRGYAFYNWYRAMGGAGSIQYWLSRGWATKDKLHLTAAGYRMQGRMLYQAMKKAMEEKR